MASLPCSDCGSARSTSLTAKGALRLPMGWKRCGDRVYCGKCWRKHYIIRTVTIPVAEPVGWEWSEFRAALTQCWEQSTGLANWAVTELVKADVVRSPSDARMPAMPRVYLYPKARERFPGLSSRTVVALLHTVEQRYRQARLTVIWWAEASLPRYRYPMPYPVTNQGWKARFGQDNVPLVDFQIGKGQFTVRLRGGPHYSRQLAAFAKIVSGEAIQGEFSLYREEASSGDHRPGMEDREPGGGRRTHFRILAKMVIWLPRTVVQHRTGTIEIRTGPDAFLTAMGCSDPWVFNADHVRRWAAQYRHMMDRLDQDIRTGKHLPKRVQQQMADHREAVVARYHRRMNSFCHQVAAALAGYADHQKVGEVRYVDDDQSYVPTFPWFELRTLLANKLEERGIKFLATGQEMPRTLREDGAEAA
jgi:hypothetical protein